MRGHHALCHVGNSEIQLGIRHAMSLFFLIPTCSFQSGLIYTRSNVRRADVVILLFTSILPSKSIQLDHCNSYLNPELFRGCPFYNPDVHLAALMLPSSRHTPLCVLFPRNRFGLHWGLKQEMLWSFLISILGECALSFSFLWVHVHFHCMTYQVYKSIYHWLQLTFPVLTWT